MRSSGLSSTALDGPTQHAAAPAYRGVDPLPGAPSTPGSAVVCREAASLVGRDRGVGSLEVCEKRPGREKKHHESIKITCFTRAIQASAFQAAQRSTDE